MNRLIRLVQLKVKPGACSRVALCCGVCLVDSLSRMHLEFNARWQVTLDEPRAFIITSPSHTAQKLTVLEHSEFFRAWRSCEVWHEKAEPIPQESCCPVTTFLCDNVHKLKSRRGAAKDVHELKRLWWSSVP